MFQTFTTTADPSQSAARIKALRALMATQGCDAVLIPRADEHQGEYVPANAERLKWLTGFTGSAGLAVVGKKVAALSTDGRYTLQAAHQIDTHLFDVVDSTTTDWMTWLAGKQSAGGIIGYDPRLHTKAAIDALVRDGTAKKFMLKPLPANPVDRIWGTSRPAPAAGTVMLHPLERAGIRAESKIADLQRTLKDDGHDAVVLTLPDSICWLLNIRGTDVAHNPTVLAFMIVSASGKPELFIDPAKVNSTAKKHLSGLVKCEPPSALQARLSALKASRKKVRLDPVHTSDWFYRRLGKSAVDGVEPCILPKAKKSTVEIEGARRAHIRDGAAVCRFLAWLDREAPRGKIDEITAVTTLENLRAATELLKEISFDTISGAGPNGAIIHYRVTEATNRLLKPGELFLIDSGGQYEDGTTDITRTIAIGKPTREMCDRYTLVLKGLIALTTTRFPKGTRGIQLDTLARHAMWQAGLDYDHGTGHGIGSYLSVHEGPQSISKRGMAPLEPGMIVSNEPGYYKIGAFGIRIENLEVVTEPRTIDGGERDMLSFETLTRAPFDRRLIALDRLTKPERAWLDAYHANVLRQIGPELGPDDRRWLEGACATL